MAHLGLDGKEIKFAQRLASNDLLVRNKTLDKLQRFLNSIDEDNLTDEELLKLWKGIFYCMWMSDKVPVQQELAKRIAQLLHYFPSIHSSLQFLKCFYLTMNREWHGIDNLRLNKFYSLQRRMLEESLILVLSDIFKNLSNNENNSSDSDDNSSDNDMNSSENIFLWCNTISESLDVNCPSIILHFGDIFIESLLKCFPDLHPGHQYLSDLQINGLLIPSYDFIQNCDDIRIVKRFKEQVFKKIITKTFDKDYLNDLDDNVSFDNDLDKHNFILSAKHPFFPYFDGIEEALLSLATSKDTLESNRSHIYELQDKFQNIRTPKFETPKQFIKYKPLTSEEAKLQRKKRKKKRKRPATIGHPPKKKIKLR